MKKFFLNQGHIVLMLGCWLLAVCLPSINYASDPTLDEQVKINEQKLKISFIYNLAKFITWPNITSTESKPFFICTLGSEPLINSFVQLQNKKINDLPIIIRSVSREQSFDNCHILFIAESEAPRLEKTLSPLTTSPVLTISTIPEFAQEKGMFTLKLLDGKVHFDMNLLNIHKAGLNVNGQLFNLADEIIK